MSNFVFPEEMCYFVDSIRPFQLLDVGSKKWLDCHEKIIKLSQQAILEATEHREEAVKEFLIVKDKLKVLIHEAYCVFLWKTRVLPHLLNVDPNPQATFLIYTVFYHEGAVISLLDTALFHESGCEALQDAAIDLVDYCAQGVAQVIGLTSMGFHENDSKFDVDEAILTELERQKRDLIFKIGLRCISILNYLADNSKSLPLSATRRMVITHDLPWLMSDLLHFRPWQRRTKKGLQKFIDDKWTDVQGDGQSKVIKLEAQTWFCLRQLLFNTSLMETYEMNDNRRKQLAKCQGLLNDSVLDQLPPLIELKQYLCHLGVSSEGNTRSQKASNLTLEEVPQICEKLTIESERVGGFLEIAQQQEKLFLCKDKEQILEMAKQLNMAYNTDLLAEMETNASNDEKQTAACGVDDDSKSGNKCGNCLADAEKKCANCKIVYYCSRKCQQDDWPKHKINCIKV